MVTTVTEMAGVEEGERLSGRLLGIGSRWVVLFQSERGGGGVGGRGGAGERRDEGKRRVKKKNARKSLKIVLRKKSS